MTTTHPDDRDPATPTPLEERLAHLIRTNGPITVADFMEDALFNPQDGYYTSGPGARASMNAQAGPIGAAGDFTTAPEISQVFGELIGLWLVQAWVDLGAPTPFNLIELGPGRGALMADALRAAKVRPAFIDAARVRLVEVSGRLRYEQQKRLADCAADIDWLDDFSRAPDGPTLVVANEFFDCLPVRQFVRTETSWRERMVALGPGEDAFAFSLAPAPPPPMTSLPDAAAPGDIYELCEPGEALAEAIGARLATEGGRALVIDYGHTRDGVGETLQAVRAHRFAPVLAAPGLSDLSAHVNFDRLIRAAFDAGAACHGPVAQGVFLDRLGLAARVERLTAGKSHDVAEAVRAGAFRIAASSQMGEIFKAICISAPGLSTPAGF